MRLRVVSGPVLSPACSHRWLRVGDIVEVHERFLKDYADFCEPAPLDQAQGSAPVEVVTEQPKAPTCSVCGQTFVSEIGLGIHIKNAAKSCAAHRKLHKEGNCEDE